MINVADARYFVQAILDVKSKAGKKAETFAKGLTRSGNSLMTAGNQFIGSMARGAGILAAVGGYALARMVKSAIAANKEMENVALATATTLQLFDRNKQKIDQVTGAVSGLNTESDQFALNLGEARDTVDKLFRIAAVSPASFQQAQQLFENMLPGAAQVEKDMGKILGLTKNALATGVLTGGDFAQAGRDLRMILTGQAGTDVRVWSAGLQTAAQNAARNMGAEFKGVAKASGKDINMAFNKLAPEKRYALVRKSLERMGIATEKAGETWDGLTSTISSDTFLLSKTFGETLFGTMKGRFKKWTSKGGLLDPTGKKFAKLERLAMLLGYWLGKGGDWVAQKLENGIDYVSNNWSKMISKGVAMWEKAMKVVKLMLTAKGVAFGVGASMKATGGAIGAGQTAFGLGKQGAELAGGLMPLVRVMAMMLPIALVAGAALGGVAVLFGGVVAWFVDNWGSLITGISEGTVRISPLTDAVAQLWTQLLALGMAIMGTSGAEDATTQMNKAIIFAAEVIYGVIGAMGVMLKTLGWVQFGFNILTMGLKTVYGGFVSLITGIIWLLKEAIDFIPGTGTVVASLDAAVESMSGHVKDVFGSVKEDVKDAEQISKLADKFIEASASGGELSKKLEDSMKNAIKSSAEGQGSSRKSKTKAPQTHIHHLEIRQDLRNHDPDRIMGAFVKKLQDVTNRPTQAVTQENYGV